MPSYSIGFAVASTWNGSGSGNVSPSTVTWRSCIASSRADCVFGGVRLISSASSTPGEQRAAAELEGPVLLVVEERAGDVGRQQVGSELHARELQTEHPGQAARGQGLAQSREVLEQHVALGQYRREHQRQRDALADDRPSPPRRAPPGRARRPRRRPCALPRGSGSRARSWAQLLDPSDALLDLLASQRTRRTVEDPGERRPQPLATTWGSPRESPMPREPVVGHPGQPVRAAGGRPRGH